MTSDTLIQSHLSHFKPITTDTAKQMAAKQNLSYERIDIINLQRLHQLAKLLSLYEKFPYSQQINSEFIVNYPPLPNELLLNDQQLQIIEPLLEPTDKMEYTWRRTDETVILLKSNILAQIYSLTMITIDGVNDDSLEMILAFCPSLEHLKIYFAKLNTEQLSMIMIRAPKLKQIRILGCDLVNSAPLYFPDQLKEITQLSIVPFEIPDEQLVALLDNTPNLIELEAPHTSRCTLTTFNLSGQLPHLTTLKLGKYTSSEHFLAIFGRAPNLTKVTFSECNATCLALAHSSEIQISPITELEMIGITYTAEQLSEPPFQPRSATVVINQTTARVSHE
jgi:hypothetical protein